MKNEKLEKTMILLGIALLEAIGLFALICGILSIRIESIGTVSSLGYVVGLCGLFFGILLLITNESKNPKYREKHS